VSLFEYLDPASQLERARRVLRQARKAPLYARKLAGQPEPQDWESWRKLPVLTRQELYDHTYPRSRDLLTRPVEGMIVTSTGGTTGVARYTLYTHAEWDVFCEMQARTFRMMGMGPADRVANLFVAGHLWPSFLGAHEAIKRVGAVHLPISANIAQEEITRLCREFDPTVMISLPTLFVLLADLAQRDGFRFPSLRLIGYAGEQMSAPAQEHVQRVLGVEDIRPLAYTSADCGLMGYPCEHCGFGEYHLPSGFQLLEVIHPDTGRPLPPGQKGEVLVTNLARQAMPILRYRLGDMAMFLEGTCPCGDPNPRFRLLGRAGEDFKLGGAYISMGQFEQAISRIPALSLNFTVEIEDVANQVVLRLLVEAPEPQAAQEVDAELRQALVQAIPEIGVGLERGYIRELDIRYLELGRLPRNPHTGKVIRLRDRRVLAPGEGQG
jgi:phenylacetate-CoA ligase